MYKWKITFIFLTGFMLREVMGHIWLGADGVLPFTSRLFGFTMTQEMNTMLIILNCAILLICAYLGFLFDWNRSARKVRHA